VNKHTVSDNLQLRTACDSFLIAFDQATEQAINYTHSCESDSEQLHTEVFKLANKLAINGYGNEAVKMHEICNGM
jgi:hypothetical protein